jgi:hypothetical protein
VEHAAVQRPHWRLVVGRHEAQRQDRRRHGFADDAEQHDPADQPADVRSGERLGLGLHDQTRAEAQPT